LLDGISILKEVEINDNIITVKFGGKHVVLEAAGIAKMCSSHAELESLLQHLAILSVCQGFLADDKDPYLEKVHCKMLAVQSAVDKQVERCWSRRCIGYVALGCKRSFCNICNSVLQQMKHPSAAHVQTTQSKEDHTYCLNSSINILKRNIDAPELECSAPKVDKLSPCENDSGNDEEDEDNDEEDGEDDECHSLVKKYQNLLVSTSKEWQISFL
jgi:hypothetical protein